MAWRLWIGGLDYSAYSDFTTWTIYESMRHRGSTAVGVVTLPKGAKPRPKGFQQVVLEHLTGGVPDYRLFGGIVQRATQAEVNQETYAYTLHCSDYTRWLDHIPVGGTVYADMSADALVKQLVNDWATRSSGGDTPLGQGPPSVPITTNHVQAMSPVIFAYQGNYLPLSQEIDQIAKQVYAVWFVDHYADLWFCLPDAAWLQAPPPVQSVTYFDQTLYGLSPRGVVTVSLPTLDADLSVAYRDLELTEDTSTVISGVAIRDYFEVSTQKLTEQPPTYAGLVGDGLKKFFPLSNMPVDPKHTKVTIGADLKIYDVASGNLKDEYQDGQPTSPGAEDWCFVCPWNQGIRFNQAPANGQNVKVEYNWYIPNSHDYMFNARLAAEIARREGFGPGAYYAVISDATLTAPINLLEGVPPWQAQELVMLNRYSRIKLLAAFRTYQAGWRPGQTFAIKSAQRGDSENAPDYNVWGTTFSMKFYVTQTEARIVNDDVVDYRVEAASDVWGM